MELQVGVKVLLKNPEGKYLLLRRSEYETIFKNKWDIPGGRIEVETNLTENLAREVMEETGLTMTSEPRVIGAQDIFVPEQNRHVVRITYVGTAEGEPTLSDEHSEYQWMTYSEMKLIPRDQLDRYLIALLESGTIPSTIE
jgi:ADP-ribose pyrophosphatase YjhB (NUDIX family)